MGPKRYVELSPWNKDTVNLVDYVTRKHVLLYSDMELLAALHSKRFRRWLRIKHHVAQGRLRALDYGR